MQAHCRILDNEGAVATSKKAKKLKKSLLVPDTAAILADFRLMGEGLVKKVEVLSPVNQFKSYVVQIAQSNILVKKNK